MEIAIVGPGEVLIRLIDVKGRALVEEKLVVSGSPTVEAIRMMALSVETTRGPTSLAPVLVSQSNPKQRVTFDREAPSQFTGKRCTEIGCTPDIAAEAERGRAAPVQGAEVILSGDEEMDRLIQSAVRSDHRKKP